MDWSKRTVSERLSVERYTVSDVIAEYLQNSFYVNRRYQRKLVWGIEEKRLLIDSIINRIPLPAILLVKYDVLDGAKGVLEIVDGMQRLNAIISFVLGEFGILYKGEMCYFDPNANNDTFNLRMDEDSRLKINTALLPNELCREFCRYQLPVIITGQDDAMVEMIFSRINSTGRKISSHDLRQSKAIGEFPDLVRRIASDVRMDNTFSDHICLCDIPKISIGSKKHGYGVDVENTFWRRHDLIGKQDLKESKDEELIETLLAIILLGSFNKTKSNLDKLYEKDSALNNLIEERVIEKGKDLLEDRFKQVFDTIDMIFSAVNSNFSSYIFSQKRTSNKDEGFKALFIALYKLVVQGNTIPDYKNVAQAIKNSKSIFTQLILNSRISCDDINTAANNLYNLLKSSFAQEVSHSDSTFALEIDKRLCYSKLESQMTEFKIGISDFKRNKVNKGVISDIAKTLVAMSNNTSAKEEGLLIIGIADDRKAYLDWHKIYKEQALIINQHYVPGVESEAEKLFGKVDTYYRELRSIISNEPISQKLKEYILETFKPVTYHGRELLVFRSKNIGEISTYNGVKYVRYANETVKL